MAQHSASDSELGLNFVQPCEKSIDICSLTLSVNGIPVICLSSIIQLSVSIPYPYPTVDIRPSSFFTEPPLHDSSGLLNPASVFASLPTHDLVG